MQIKTKFDIGQEVWFVAEGGIKKAVVDWIHIEVFTTGCNNFSIIYVLKRKHFSDCKEKEEYLFATIEELVNSLLES